VSDLTRADFITNLSGDKGHCEYKLSITDL